MANPNPFMPQQPDTIAYNMNGQPYNQYTPQSMYGTEDQAGVGYQRPKNGGYEHYVETHLNNLPQHWHTEGQYKGMTLYQIQQQLRDQYASMSPDERSPWEAQAHDRDLRGDREPDFQNGSRGNNIFSQPNSNQSNTQNYPNSGQRRPQLTEADMQGSLSGGVDSFSNPQTNVFSSSPSGPSSWDYGTHGTQADQIPGSHYVNDPRYTPYQVGGGAMGQSAGRSGYQGNLMQAPTSLPQPEPSLVGRKGVGDASSQAQGQFANMFSKGVQNTQLPSIISNASMSRPMTPTPAPAPTQHDPFSNRINTPAAPMQPQANQPQKNLFQQPSLNPSGGNNTNDDWAAQMQRNRPGSKFNMFSGNEGVQGTIKEGPQPQEPWLYKSKPPMSPQQQNQPPISGTLQPSATPVQRPNV